MLDILGAQQYPIQNLSDADAIPAIRGSESIDWSQSRDRQTYLVPLGRAIVRIETSSSTGLPDWLRRAITKLNEISELGENWDSYRARPVPQRTLEHALEVLLRLSSSSLAQPEIQPMPNGGIALSWYRGERELELKVERPFLLHALFVDANNPANDWEGPVGLELEEIIHRGESLMK